MDQTSTYSPLVMQETSDGLVYTTYETKCSLLAK